MKIVEVPILEITPYKNNPRNNEAAVDAVAESIKEFGFKVPIVLDKNKTVVCGHTRLIAAFKLNYESVPCIMANDLTEAQIKAYRLADNKTGEIAEWDFEKLNQELQELTAFDVDMSLFGFDESIFEEEQVVEEEFDAEEAIESIIEPKTKEGDIYKLGNHYLMCGDSTSEEDVKKLLHEKRVNLLVTDPPYNVSYEGATADKLTIKNDNMSDSNFYEFLKKAFTNSFDYMEDGAAFYIWHSDAESFNFRKACADSGLTLKQCLIWVKNTFVMGRQDYQCKHEPCLYGWKSGAAHYFIEDRTQSTVLEFNKPSKNGEHPTMKPLELISLQIKNSSKQNDKVLDLFGGSGTTLIACEQLNRQCFMMELDPKYCDVIVKRFESLTGGEAELISK